MVTQLLKQLPAFYGIRMFITVRIESIPHHKALLM